MLESRKWEGQKKEGEVGVGLHNFEHVYLIFRTQGFNSTLVGPYAISVIGPMVLVTFE